MTSSTVVTATLNSYGVSLPEPTDRMRLAVEYRDAGKSNVEIGEAMNCTGGSAGNLITNGLRRMGRETEIGGTGTKASVVTKPRTRAEIIEAALEAEKAKLHKAIERLDTRVTAASLAIVEFDTEAWIATRTTELEAAVTAARDTLKAFKANSEQHAADALNALPVPADIEARDADERAALVAAIAAFDAE